MEEIGTTVPPVILSCAKQFFSKDLPNILHAAARALQKAPLPSSYEELTKLTLQQWIKLSPTIACIFFFCLLPFIFINHSEKAAQRNGRKNTYWLTRILIIRFVGIIYFAAFTTLAFQFRALYGTNGIFPVQFHTITKPTPIFNLFDESIRQSNWFFESLSWLGILLALFMVFDVIQTFLIPLSLWLIYLSFLNLGTNITNYGWEWLTLEIGFLTIFLCPIFSFTNLPRHTPPSKFVIWLFRWLAFRLLIGAGLSKLGSHSSVCWMELTCTETHYFTQPMPNLFAYFAHHAPAWFHHLEVSLTFFEQLVLPFFILVPIRPVRLLAGMLEVFFQFSIVFTGNYAWINFVGMLPCFSLFDDEFLGLFYSKHSNVESARIVKQETRAIITRKRKPFALSSIYKSCRNLVYICLIIFIAYKSAAPIQELFTDSPWLHTYDDYYFVTSQGVFGFINSNRVVLTLQYTLDDHPDFREGKSSCRDSKQTGLQNERGEMLKCSDLANFCTHKQYGAQIRSECPKSCGVCSQSIPYDVEWKNLDFKNLPGSLDRAPWFNSPIHYRFDWEVWIHTTASMEHYHQSALGVPRFIEILISKILAGDTDALSLMGTNLNGTTPLAIKAEYYLYYFSEPEELKENGVWWTRKPIPNAKAKLYTQLENKWPSSVTQAEIVHRNWLLLLSTVAICISVKYLLQETRPFNVLCYCGYLLTFAALFLNVMAIEYQFYEYILIPHSELHFYFIIASTLLALKILAGRFTKGDFFTLLVTVVLHSAKFTE